MTRGAEVRKYREAAGISLTLLADRADIDVSNLSRFETGERLLSEKVYYRLRATIYAIRAERDVAAEELDKKRGG